MQKKTKSNMKPTAVYISESDAGVLGIYDGGFQNVLIDERPVTVSFVDEHEIIPMSEVEQKLSKEAVNISKKYEEIYAGHKNAITTEQPSKQFVAKKFYSTFDLWSIKKQNKKINTIKNKQPSVLKSCQLSDMEVEFVSKLLEKAKGINSAKK